MADLSKPLDGLGLAQVNQIINNRLAKKQNVLTPGDGISIVEQGGKTVISSAGGSGDTAYLINAPLGAIVVWSGTAENVPEGWSICNGENGTLDLRDKFVLAAGDGHEVGETGGSEEVTLTIDQMPQHDHRVNVGTNRTNDMVSAVYRTNVNELRTEFRSGYAGSSQPHPNMPPYYTALYIQKTGITPNDYVTREDVEEIVQEAGGEIYSTEETVIGKWIDGRPLYCRAAEIKINVSTATYVNAITFDDMENIVFIDAGCKYVSNNVIKDANMRLEDNILQVQINRGVPYPVIVKYFKTTDQGS